MYTYFRFQNEIDWTLIQFTDVWKNSSRLEESSSRDKFNLLHSDEKFWWFWSYEGGKFSSFTSKKPVPHPCKLHLRIEPFLIWSKNLMPKKGKKIWKKVRSHNTIPDLLSYNTVDFLVLFLDDHMKLPRHDAGNKNPCIGLHLLGQLMSCKEYIQDICK